MHDPIQRQDDPARGLTSVLRPKPVEDALIGRTLGGRLFVEERIGEGALGVVYRARHLHLVRPVAVKVLHPHVRNHPDYRDRFHAEARAASTLDHPTLVRVVDFGEQQDGSGLLWLAMEMLEGVALDERLFAEKRLPVADALAIVLEVAAGLAHAHGRGIVHGDVKPANVVLVSSLDDDGAVREHVKLCDFGLARLASSESGAVHGTPAYMSPEQCLGGAIDGRSDVYSLGVLLYELVSGEEPFVSEDPVAVLRQHLVAEPVPVSARVPNAPPPLDKILAKALAKDPERRYPSMRELRADLKALLAALGVEERPSSPYVEPAAPPRPQPASAAPPRVAYTSEIRELVPSRGARALAAALVEGDVDAIARHGALLIETTDEALRLLDDPARLRPLADALLADEILATPYLEAVLGRAGRAAARALWDARIAGPVTPDRRRRFVGWLAHSGGFSRRPPRDMLLAALARLRPSIDAQPHPDLAEDILLAVPAKPDATLAAAVELFLFSPHARVRQLAKEKLG